MVSSLVLLFGNFLLGESGLVVEDSENSATYMHFDIGVVHLGFLAIEQSPFNFLSVEQEELQ